MLHDMDYATSLAGLLNLRIDIEWTKAPKPTAQLYIGPADGRPGRIWRFPWNPQHQMSDAEWNAIFKEIKEWSAKLGNETWGGRTA
jgi:hypothetical protein